MTAAGREDQIEKAKEIIKATIIGLAIVMSAYAITFFVTSKLGGTGGGSASPGSSLDCSSIKDEQTCYNAGCGWSPELASGTNCGNKVQ